MPLLVRTMFVLLPLLASPAYSAWVEEAWGWMPLENVQESIASETALIARGASANASIRLYHTSRPAQTFVNAPTESQTPALTVANIAFGKAWLGREGSTYALELASPIGERHLVLLLEAERPGADLVTAAAEVLRASAFLPRPAGDLRATLLPGSNGVLSLPMPCVPHDHNTWLERDTVNGSVASIVRVLPIIPSRDIPDAARMQREAEKTLIAREVKALEGGSLTLFGRASATRTMERAGRSLATIYTSAGDWLYMILIESRTRERLNAIVETIATYSCLLTPQAEGLLSSRGIGAVQSVIGIADSRGRLRMAFLDGQGKPVSWHGPAVPVELRDGEGRNAGDLRLTGSWRLSLAGPGWPIDTSIVTAVVHLPGGVTYDVDILRPPE
ncbi:MAG: hypothetical protein L6Q71_08630 [Planctomycetes bacterium]|nr:hypothetical protein [Planctomycetota bacterium]NUQ34821.1 hypothetical protein [Planctomycetaceae bacterium]